MCKMINLKIYEKNYKTFAFLADISVFLANYLNMFTMFDIIFLNC